MIQCMREQDGPFYLQNAKVMAIGVCKMNIVKNLRYLSNSETVH